MNAPLRRGYLANGTALGFLIAQMLIVVLMASGAAALPWWVAALPALAGVAYLAVSAGTFYVLDARDRVQRRVWRRFDYDAADRAVIAPALGERVWIVEDHYLGGVGIGWFDGVTFRTATHGDDCSVSWWAPITYPEPPALWKRDRARWEASEDAEEDPL